MALPSLPPFNRPIFPTLSLHSLPALLASLSLFAFLSYVSAMKLTLSPIKLLRSKKSRSVSRHDPSSFGSGTSSDSLDSASSTHKSHAGTKVNGLETPKSVLPSHSLVMSDSSGDWSGSEVAQAFRLIDSDGDGKVTRKDLEALLSRVGGEPPSEEELMTMLSEVDKDGDGCISLEALGEIVPALWSPACDSELRDAFDFFDTDHDGKITAEELHAVFAAIGDDRCTLEDCRRMIRGVDKNGDGFVCFEDFVLMMEQQHR